MSNESFSLRPATVDDLPGVLEIERQSQPAPWNEESFRGEMSKPYSHFLVMTDDETDSKIAGFIVYWLLLEECQILELAVAPDFRRRGLAKIMVRQAIRDGLKQGFKKAILDVRKSNVAAIQLYQTIGFSITQLRKGFYSNGEDAYQMDIRLEEDGIRF